MGVPVLADQSLRHALPSGSRVLTARGEVLAETITTEDRVITRDFGLMPVRDVIRTQSSKGAAMTLIPAGSMGQARPERDLLLPPDQPIALRDWRARTIFGAKEARVAIARLEDGRVVRRAPANGAALWSIILDRPCVIYVDGLELVSASLDAMQSA